MNSVTACVARKGVRCGAPTSIAVLSFALLLVAACGNREEQQRTADGDTPTVLASSGDAKVVHIYNWVDYIEPTLLEKFTAETASEPEIAWAKLAALAEGARLASAELW